MITLPYFSGYQPDAPNTMSVLHKLAGQSSQMNVYQRLSALAIAVCLVAQIGLLVVGFHSHCCVAFSIITLNLLVLCLIVVFVFANKLIKTTTV